MVDIAGAKITNEKNVTADDILAEANHIWAECKRVWSGQKAMDDFDKVAGQKGERFGVDDYDKMDALFSIVYQRHPQFGQSYPTVLRHMVQEQHYNSDAFKLYLHKIEAHPWTNDSERMDSYTDYFILLYKKTHPKYSNTTINYLWNDYRKRLQEAHDGFLDKFKKIEEDVSREQKKYEMDNKRELIERVKKMIEDGVVKQSDKPPPIDNNASPARDELNNMINNLLADEL